MKKNPYFKNSEISVISKISVIFENSDFFSISQMLKFPKFQNFQNFKIFIISKFSKIEWNDIFCKKCLHNFGLFNFTFSKMIEQLKITICLQITLIKILKKLKKTQMPKNILHLPIWTTGSYLHLQVILACLILMIISYTYVLNWIYVFLPGTSLFLSDFEIIQIYLHLLSIYNYG